VGSFWDAHASTNTAADSYIASNSPSASFVSTLVDYPSGSANTSNNSDTLAILLGTDALSLNPPSAKDTTVAGSIFLLTGFIEIKGEFDLNGGTDPIDTVFKVGSDDGMRLRIGGVTVTEHWDNRSFSFADDTGLDGEADFEAPGLYPVELLFWNMVNPSDGHGGVEWCSSIVGGFDSGCPAGTVGIVPTSILSTVPEPSAALLLATGLIGLAINGRRRRA
jgi:hypothetical protein